MIFKKMWWRVLILMYIDIHSVIGDAPARAFIKCVKQYSDYHKCDNAYEKANGKDK